MSRAAVFGAGGRAALLLALALSGPAAWAQQTGGAAPRTPVGEVGQRQTREEASPNAAPLERVQGRVANRVQSRLRNRIDRYYDPQANAASPFANAADQARVAGRAPR